ncbi:MAG TPA: S1C family serine protease [Intrasporangium sp.]|uniref:S1C family serine protease n=1 Tax=Intrasporangium sp. TaxID=1925024 RepID=UPI002D78B8D7|nr:S1C family serine protease [Intrasporangium sp.]HET7399713.1 S1C family serine protease [Intrasporangium sp.]
MPAPPSASSATSDATTRPLTPVVSSPSAGTLKSAFALVRSGVVRIQSADCTTSGQGSGFLLGPDLVVTVAHVVRGAQAVRVMNGTMAAAGEVIGYDDRSDLALVRSAVRFPGRILAFAASDPEVGDQVAAVGYTLGSPLSFKPGTVNSTGRKATIGGITRHGLIELDFASNHGNSGGPVIDADGNVVGLVDAQTDVMDQQGAKSGELQGDRLAVAASVARPAFERWRVRPEPPSHQPCPQAVGIDGRPLPVRDMREDVATQALQTLEVYFSSLNAGDNPTAVAQLARGMSLADFSDAVKSTRDSDFRVGDVSLISRKPVVWLRFTSRQDPGDGPQDRPGEICTRWSLDYHFSRVNGLWLIDRAVRHGTDPVSMPCPR